MGFGMDMDLLCTWLKLPRGSWPPNHYAILGLEPGMHDPIAIEERVHERMEILRRYQLTNPELATEAMNRLAQAMICLTDERTRAVYQAEFFPPKSGLAPLPPAPGPTPAAPVLPPPDSLVETAPANPFVFDQALPAPESPAPIGATAEAEAGAKTPAVAKSNLRTRRELYFRISRTRQILRLWSNVGTLLNDPGRRLMRPSEATDLIRRMQALPPLIRSLQSRLGEAGQPGYLVLALARQQLIVPTLQTLLPSQRLALARDWEAGHDFLLEHYDDLRRQSRALRQHSSWRQAFRLGRILLHPGWIFLALVLVALNIAFPELRPLWARQAFAVICVIALRLLWWWASSRFVREPLPEPAIVSSQRSSKRGRTGRLPGADQ